MQFDLFPSLHDLELRVIVRKAFEAPEGRKLRHRFLAPHYASRSLAGRSLQKAEKEDRFKSAVTIARLLALTGCRRGEIINLQWAAFDADNSCLRLMDTKEGASVRPAGLPVFDNLEGLRSEDAEGVVVPGTVEGATLVGFPKLWKKIVKDTPLKDITPHVLRHSFASIANDLGFTEKTIASLVGHSRYTITSRYIHTVDTALIMAADTISGYVNGLLNNVTFKRKVHALDRTSRETMLARLLAEPINEPVIASQRLAA